MNPDQAKQLEEASNLWFKEIREEREKNARLTDQLEGVSIPREVYDKIAEFFTGDDDVDEDALKQFLECGKC